jgi:hypothetical protein
MAEAPLWSRAGISRRGAAVSFTIMQDGPHPAEDGTELAAWLRQNITSLRTLRERELDPARRSRIERLLAEAEAALGEVEIPQEG